MSDILSDEQHSPSSPVVAEFQLPPATRQVVTRAPSRTVRIINMNGLLPQAVEAESSLEADYIRRAAFEPTTRKVIHQPFKLPISSKGYTPDFLQLFESSRPAVVEIKLEKKVAKYSDLFDRAAEFLAKHGYTFYVLTDRTLRDDKINERALLLRRYAKGTYSQAEHAKLVALMKDYPAGLRIDDLVKKAGVSHELVLHCIAKKTLTTGPKLLVDDSAHVKSVEPSVNSEDFSFEAWFNVTPWQTSPNVARHS